MKHVLQKHTPRVKLRMAREIVGWSQEDLATRLGARQVTISRWETGETSPSRYFRTLLCELFGKHPQDLDLEADSSLPRASGTLIDPLIPPLPPLLVGREKEVVTLRARLGKRGQALPLIMVNGLPGVGKTTLAAAVAHDAEIRAQFPDGVLWAPLGTTPDTFGQLRRWATLLGLGDLDARHPDSLPLAIRSAIGNQHLLLILDDAWTMEDILALQVGGPHCAYLVTTRFLHLTRLVADMPVSLGEFSTEQSLDLLRQLAPQVVEGEASRTYALVEAVGGLPLALMLMGNYLRLHAIGGQSRRIQEALEQLNHAEMRLHLSELRGPFQHHPSLSSNQSLSLHTIIGLTNQHLSQQARTTLVALGVLPHKPAAFSEAVALAVGDCPTNVLDPLVDMGLLESAGDGYYTLHQTISDYARLHLQRNDPHERLITYAVAFLQTHHADYELLDRELSTLLLAMEAASPLNQQARLIHLACAIAPFLMLRGNYSLAERHLQQAYDAAVVLADDPGIITTLLLLGQVAQKQGTYTQAETDFREALTLARKNNDPERISAALKDLGRATWKRGNYALAEVYLKEGLALARQIEDPERMCDLLQALGVVLDVQGNYIQETAYLQEGLTLARNMGDVERVCEALIHLGVALIEHGDAMRGERHLQEGLALARTIGHEEQLHAEVAVCRADGFPAEFLDRKAIQRLIKTKLAAEIRGGRLKPGQGLVHSARFVRGLAQAALRRGARIYHAEVQALVPDGESLRLQTSRGTIQAATVVVAANAWIGRLLPQLADLILPEREQMLAYAPIAPVFSHALSADMTAGEYFQQTPDGTILIGGCNTVAPGEDMGFWEMTPLPVVQNAIEAVLPRLFPSLAPLQVVQRWAGLLDYTTDRHPIVDRLPTMPQVLVVCGFSGHGMPFGLRFGQLLTEAVVSGTLPSALKPYRLDRPTLKPWKRVW